jgi:hypothetical protein
VPFLPCLCFRDLTGTFAAVPALHAALNEKVENVFRPHWQPGHDRLPEDLRAIWTDTNRTALLKHYNNASNAFWFCFDRATFFSGRLFDCQLLAAKGFDDTLDFFIDTHKAAAIELRWNVVVGNKHDPTTPVLTKVVRQVYAANQHDPYYLSVEEHLRLLDTAVGQFKARKGSKCPHFRGVSVTLTTPRSSSLYRQHVEDRKDPFAVGPGLAWCSLEAFLDFVRQLSNTPEGHLIGAVDFVGPEETGRPWHDILDFLYFYKKHHKLQSCLPSHVKGHIHGAEFSYESRYEKAHDDKRHHSNNMAVILEARREGLVDVTRIGHGFVAQNVSCTL